MTEPKIAEREIEEKKQPTEKDSQTSGRRFVPTRIHETAYHRPNGYMAYGGIHIHWMFFFFGNFFRGDNLI